MAEPSNENISLFATLTNLPNAQAVTWLKAHNNNLNNATNAYLDNPNSLPVHQSVDTWDEGQFHSEQTDNGPQGQGRSCEDPWKDMEGGQPDYEGMLGSERDTLNPSIFVDSAPSRPPSRVSTRGTEASTENAVVPRQLTIEEQEAEHLETALALSMGQEIPGQESGVLEASNPYSNPYFGPAKREDYDSNEWTMTATGSHTKEILLNPDPIDRKRENNMPAFLKPSPQGYQLSALIKILQAIPMSREALLCREHVFGDYGYDTEWWDGTPIKVPKIVNLSQEDHYTDRDEVIHETQRLVAFLEETDRAYGSSDVLAGMDGILRAGVDSVTASFLEEWRKAFHDSGPDLPLLDIFQSVGTKQNPNEPEAEQRYLFFTLDVRIDEGIAEKGQTLYEAIDDLLWADQSETSYDQVYLETVADVFVIQATRAHEAGSGLGIKIPSVWYSDRYLQSSIEQVKEMRAGKTAVHRELARIDGRKAKLAAFKGSAPTDAIQLLENAAAYFEASASTVNAIDEARTTLESDSSSFNRKKHGRIADELKAVTERIAQKLKTFELLKERAREKLDEFSKLYTKPTDDPDAPPHHKYTLRGVCSLSHTCYVLEKTQLEAENNTLDSEVRDWQWWKISYVGTDSKPVSRTKVREIEVMKAARDESRSSLLVYASEKAVSYEAGDLPQQLRDFVRTDNLSFAAELEKSASPKPATPTKRKADDSNYDELGPKLYRSSPQRKGKENEFLQPSRPIDATLPAYKSSSSPPSSYDDMVPLSLRSDSASEAGQEMEDRGGRLAIGNGSRRADRGDAWGTYEPGIMMEDREEDEVGQTRHVEFARGEPQT